MIRRLFRRFRPTPSRYARGGQIVSSSDVTDALAWFGGIQDSFDCSGILHSPYRWGPGITLEPGEHLWAPGEFRELARPALERLRWRIWLERQADDARGDLTRIVEAAYERAGLDFVPANIVRGAE